MEDIEFLRSGFYVMFEVPGQGPFLLMDESRLPRPAGDSNFRILFYLDYIFRHELYGVTTIHVVSSRYRPPPDMRRDMYDIVGPAIRLQHKAFHVVQAYEEGKDMLVEYLGFKTARTHEFRTRIHVKRLSADSRAGTLKMLQEMGFCRQRLPSCLGGDYDYGQYADWIRMRTSVEDIMSSAPVKANRLSLNGIPRVLVVGDGPVDAPIKRRSNGKKSAPQHLLTNGSGNEESAAELHRRRNALYSRRANKKRELTLLSLQDQEKILQARNKILKNENARLQYLVNMAQCALANSLGQLQATSKHGR